VTRLRILVAEDEPAVAASIGEQLTALGHEVIAEAATGQEAVALAARQQPDLVIMDIKMPDGDGVEAARRIAEQSPLPVVFLTGYFDEELLAGAAESGGLAYLLKPASSDQLQAALTLARRRFEEMKGMRKQVERVTHALEARKLVARAKGLLMERHALTEEEAHRRMQKEASRSNMKLVDLARALLAAGPFLGEKDDAARSGSPRGCEAEEKS
jgi:AmiR/NasT family two-component response regulator